MMTQACSDLYPTPLPFFTLPKHTTKSNKATIQNDILIKISKLENYQLLCNKAKSMATTWIQIPHITNTETIIITM